MRVNNEGKIKTRRKLEENLTFFSFQSLQFSLRTDLHVHKKKHCKELFTLLLNLLLPFLFPYFIVALFHGFFNKHFKSCDTENIRNTDFYKRCMKDALESLK